MLQGRPAKNQVLTIKRERDHRTGKTSLPRLGEERGGLGRGQIVSF